MNWCAQQAIPIILNGSIPLEEPFYCRDTTHLSMRGMTVRDKALKDQLKEVKTVVLF